MLEGLGNSGFMAYNCFGKKKKKCKKKMREELYSRKE
jgi:hypothetical protein